jgi:hypothetical protein
MEGAIREMSDIVNRLRAQSPGGPSPGYDPLCREAAAVIARLHNHLTHAAGFVEGMAARLERWRPLADDAAIAAAAEDLQKYASSLRKLVGMVTTETTADPSSPAP